MENQSPNLTDPDCVVIDGEMTIAQAADHYRTLRQALARGRSLVVDLGAVSEFDSAGFQVLAMVRREAERLGVSLQFTPLSPTVRTVLERYRALAAMRQS